MSAQRFDYNHTVPEKKRRAIERDVGNVIWAARTYHAPHPDRPQLTIEVQDRHGRPRREPMRRLGQIIDMGPVTKDNAESIHGALLSLLAETRATIPDLKEGES